MMILISNLFCLAKLNSSDSFNMLSSLLTPNASPKRGPGTQNILKTTNYTQHNIDFSLNCKTNNSVLSFCINVIASQGESRDARRASFLSLRGVSAVKGTDGDQ